MDTIGGYYWWWNHIEIPAGFKLGSSECWSDALTNWATGALALELDTAQFQDGSLWCRLYSAWWMLKQLTVLSTKVFLLQPQQAGYQQSLFMCHQNPIKGWNKVFFCLLKTEIVRCIFGELFGGEKWHWAGAAAKCSSVLNMRSCFDDGYGAELHEAHIQCIGSKACWNFSLF